MFVSFSFLCHIPTTVSSWVTVRVCPVTAFTAVQVYVPLSETVMDGRTYTASWKLVGFLLKSHVKVADGTDVVEQYNMVKSPTCADLGPLMVALSGPSGAQAKTLVLHSWLSDLLIQSSLWTFAFAVLLGVLKNPESQLKREALNTFWEFAAWKEIQVDSTKLMLSSLIYATFYFN